TCGPGSQVRLKHAATSSWKSMSTPRAFSDPCEFWRPRGPSRHFERGAPRLHRSGRYVTQPRDFCGIPGRAAARRKTASPTLISWAWRPSVTVPGPRIAERTRLPTEAVTPSGMAGRYATALFELALEANAVGAVKSDLDRFDALV